MIWVEGEAADMNSLREHSAFSVQTIAWGVCGKSRPSIP